MSRLDPDSESCLNKSIWIRLHDDGWFVTFALMALVLISGVYGLVRVSQQQEAIQEMRVELQKVDEMLQERTSRFRAIETNQHKIMDALKIHR